MSQYIFILVWLFIMGIIGFIIPVERYENVFGKNELRVTWIYAICTFLPVIIMASLRKDIGDTYAYQLMFKNLPTTFDGLISYLPHVTKDKGFTVLGGLIKIIFGNSTIIYFSILAIIQGIGLVAIYRKYSSSYWISIFLFIASSDYLSWMFNGIRQFTAVCIIFAATPLMLKKKWISLIITILFAATIHGSALLMLPIVFVVQGKPWNKKTIGFIVLCIAVLVFANQFTNVLETLLSDTQYTNVVSDWKQINDTGTNYIRVLVYSVPMLLAFIGRKWLEDEDNQVINLCINMSIITSGLYLVSAVTSGVFIGRLPIFTSLYSYILMPYIIDQMFTAKSARLIKIVMIGLYLIFYYYQIHIAWTLI